MAAYIQETGRSFPNPTKGTDFTSEFKRPASGDYDSHGDYPGVGTGMAYTITFEGGGPGTMPMGKDVVHYIGDDDPTNVSGKTERQPIYRWYRGSKDDHMYTNLPRLIKSHLGCENESWKKAAGGYNPEPRSGAPVFYVMTKQVENSVPLKAYYSYWPDDSQLCVGTNVPTGLNGVGCGRNKYKYITTLGYVFTSQADADEYCTGGETAKPLYEYLHPDPDHFYTITPETEVNLEGIAEGGPADPAQSYNKEYAYLGILCYAFAEPPRDAPTDLIRDIGKIGPTGMPPCIDKSGWYDYTFGQQATWNGIVNGMGAWTEFMYLQMRDAQGNNVEGPPAINGWGNPDNVEALSNDAFFEWSYGLSGAVKGAIPRYLGFEDMYDSQFVFYLYDTSYPWNGPIFSTQYILSNAQCCPNTTDPEGCPQCAPVWTYHSHFYEIQEDVWNTTHTDISIHDESSVGVKESFWTIGTGSTTIFFRYLTRTGDFNRGETINGWDINSVYYFGDELKCGVMELTWNDANDNKWYVNPACVAWRLTDTSAVEVTNSLAEKGAWVGPVVPNNPAVPWSNFMKTYGIYPSIPADDVVDPLIGVWQVHTATFTITTAGDYSLAIESDNYGYMKITDSGGTVLVDREIVYASGMGSEVFQWMTLGPGTYTLETRVMNINRATTQEPFTYQEQFTSSDGGTAEILAGYGIPNKAAFCGTYEFPKKISYWKVQLNPKALIPSRTLDEAELEAVVSDSGEVIAVNIINGGRGYVNPTISVMNPRELENFSPTDTADFMEDSINSDYDYDKAIGNPSVNPGEFKQRNMKSAMKAYGSQSGIIKLPETKDKDKIKIRRAQVEISEIDTLGVIKSIRVIDGGAGYNQAEAPYVHLVEPEHIEYQSDDAGANELNDTHKQMGEAWNHQFDSPYLDQPIGANFDSETMGYVQSSFGVAQEKQNTPTSVYVEVPDSYVRAANDGVDDDKTTLCMNLPAACKEINARGYISQAMPDEEVFSVMSSLDPSIANLEKDVMPYAYKSTSSVDDYGENMSHLYGPFGKKRCIEVSQPRLYNIARWFDMPCAYLDVGDDGEQKAFGWLPYKYCASTEKEASFRVSLSCEGYVGGSQGPAFMDWFASRPVPYLQEKREAPGNAGKRMWNCRRGSIPGRCYRDPNNSSDIIFVPVGQDENTWDYNRAEYTELEQLQMWAGDNITSSAAVQTWLGHPTANDPAGTPHSVDYTALTVAACTNGQPPNDCWDRYVRGVVANDGPLTVYCGYDNQGNGLAGQTYCNTPELHNNHCLALDKVLDSSIAVTPKRVRGSGADMRMLMGPYNGTMSVRNYLTGGVIALDKAIKNYGNPYFDECSEENSWYSGTEINEKERGINQ